MENKCTFYSKKPSGGTECRALTECNCAGCSFFKTEQQFNDDLEAAEARLRAKGLKPVKKYKNGQMVMTVEERSADEWLEL